MKIRKRKWSQHRPKIHLVHKVHNVHPDFLGKVLFLIFRKSSCVIQEIPDSLRDKYMILTNQFSAKKPYSA